MECGKAPSGIRKGKKKQVKDELDRNKQAEKKKRRLEKALATSAAIISELERKKEKKKEEQQRLDQEGAAIAEAVALQVLIGEEDPEEPDSWDIDLFVGGSGSGSGCRTTAAILSDHRLSTSPNEETGWVYNGHWNGFGSFISNVRAPYFSDGSWEGTDRWPAEVIVSDAVSSLQIVDDEDVDACLYLQQNSDQLS
ncbi:hypothetical protein L6452_14825 [Arctium lappa]|uniref:Uncharacterized protein n=1 Tax=Arctium lappa TaxID=4217 RepID=A0ACB9CM54_ARCLA|nr:hypothetical protein L6452_14825 [Arctium lappa]